MAEGSSMLKQFQSLATCAHCKHTLTEPKRLPCDHVVCESCLHGLAAITGTISCPECHMDIPMPNNGVTDFPTAHQAIQCLEVYQECLKSKAAMPQPATCKVHISQPLALYCETCEKLLCRMCATLLCTKRDHNYGLKEDMEKKYKSDFTRELEAMKKQRQKMTSALESISTANRELQRKMEQIQEKFDALAEILAKQRRCFTYCTEKSLKENSAKKREASKALLKMNSLIQSLDTASHNQSTSEFLLSVLEKKGDIEALRK